MTSSIGWRHNGLAELQGIPIDQCFHKETQRFLATVQITIAASYFATTWEGWNIAVINQALHNFLEGEDIFRS